MTDHGFSIDEIDAYNNLHCHNITLEDFVLERRNEQLKNGQIEAEYNALKVVEMKINNVDLRAPKNLVDPLPRCIIIDGANVMHGGSPYRDDRDNNNHRSIPDVAALLSVIRYFIVHDFEVFAVISRKYTKPDATNFKAAIDKLIKHDLCVIAPQTNLDDTVALEFAEQVNGIVLTNDQYRDHANSSDRLCRIVSDNRLLMEWDDVPKSSQNCLTTKGDYIASKKFRFVHEDLTTMSPSRVLTTLYSTPLHICYRLTQERLNKSRPKEKRNARIALLNELILEGLSVCGQRADEIRNTPVHDPVEARRQAVANEAETTRRTDSQREFIEDEDEEEDEYEW